MATKSVLQLNLDNQQKNIEHFLKKAWARHGLLCLVFIAGIYGLQGQTFFQSLPVGLANVNLQGQTKDLSTLFTISANEDKDGLVRVSIKDSEGESTDFSLSPLAYDLFRIKLEAALKKKVKNINGATAMNIVDEAQVTRLFAAMVTQFNVTDTRPEIAKMKLKEKIPVYDKKDGKPCFYLENAMAEIAFYEGFVEKIEVEGTFDGQSIRFSNTYSVGISSLDNVKRLSRVSLYSEKRYHTYNINGQNPPDEAYRIIPYNAGSIDPSITVNDELRSLRITLNDVIDYNRTVDVNANDISPENGAVTLDADQRSVTLHKEESTKILEAIVYSDFFGVFDEENPNGVIQTELTKRFNLITTRRDGPKFFSSSRSGYGWFEHFDLDFRVTKLEEDNRYLEAENKISLANGMDSIPAFSLLSAYQHQNFLFGGVLNVLTFEKQDSKTNFEINAGFNFGRSGVMIGDDENNLNTLQFPLSAKLRIAPEKRYGLQISNEFRYLRILSNQGFEIQTIKNGESAKSSEWLNISSLMGYLNVSERGKLFVRYGLVFELGNINDNFSMFQFGYSFYVLGRNTKRR